MTPIAFMLLVAELFLVPFLATVEREAADVTPPIVLSVTLSTDTIDTSVGDVTITATLHVSDDLSGLTSVYIRMRPLEVIRTPDAVYEYHVTGHCYYDPSLLDAICSIPMTVFQYAYEGVWAIEYIEVRDRLLNTRRIFHPELPGSWNSDTGEVTQYYCTMYDNECLPPELGVTFTNGLFPPDDPAYSILLPLVTRQ